MKAKAEPGIVFRAGDIVSQVRGNGGSRYRGDFAPCHDATAPDSFPPTLGKSSWLSCTATAVQENTRTTGDRRDERMVTDETVLRRAPTGRLDVPQSGPSTPSLRRLTGRSAVASSSTSRAVPSARIRGGDAEEAQRGPGPSVRPRVQPDQPQAVPKVLPALPRH